MKLIIYCAGGFGKEICDLAEKNNKWSEIFFIDDIKSESKFYNKRLIKFEQISNMFDSNEIEFIIANGEPFVREMLFNKVKNAGYAFATIIDSSSIISGTATIKAGSIVCSNCFVSSNVVIEENCVLQPKCNVGHESCIGSNSIISSFVSIAGACSIGQNVYIGMSVPVKEKIKIGDGSIIGIGACVSRDISENMIALGNPAREMKHNDSKKVFS